MNANKALNALDRIERRMGDTYRWLSEAISDQEISGLFFRLSMQEEAHANLIRYAKRQLAASPSEFGPIGLSEADVDEFMVQIDSFRAQNSSPTTQQAMQFAVRMESQAVENLHRRAVAESNPGMARLLEQLAAGDRDHLQMVRELARRCAVSSDESD